jgi:hypothetical protein
MKLDKTWMKRRRSTNEAAKKSAWRISEWKRESRIITCVIVH